MRLHGLSVGARTSRDHDRGGRSRVRIGHRVDSLGSRRYGPFVTHAGAVALLSLPVLGAVVAGMAMVREAARRPHLALEDLMMAFAWVYPVGAAFWLEAWLTDSSRLGFGAPWTWLTASHFMAAGFGALTVSAWLTRMTHGRARRVMHVLLFVHPVAFAAVAAGLTGVPMADEVGAPLYAALFVVQAGVVLFATERRGPFAARVGLGLAALVPVATLVPAVGWASGRPLWSMDEMVRFHGITNAIGHAGLGLAMLAWIRPQRRQHALDAPLSRLHAPGRVDASVLGEGCTAVSGLTDDLGAYRRDDFDPADLPSEVIAFYEHTDDFELDLYGRWHGIFVVGGWLWTRIIAPMLGQLGLPPPGHAARDAALDSRIVNVEDARDGRSSVRGWVRHWTHNGAVLYVAAYAEHVRAGIRYMNIAFALPRGFNMTSILHLARADDGALTLTSRHDEHPDGDQGVYLVRRGRPLRTPLDETIAVYDAANAPPDVPAAEGSSLVARHEMWLAGVPYLTMHYQIRRRRPA